MVGSTGPAILIDSVFWSLFVLRVLLGHLLNPVQPSGFQLFQFDGIRLGSIIPLSGIVGQIVQFKGWPWAAGFHKFPITDPDRALSLEIPEQPLVGLTG